jgi:hypothetical protein
MEAFDGGVLDGAVHRLDLSIGPGVLDLGQPVVDLMLATNAVEDVLEGVDVPVVMGEPDAIVRQNNVGPVGHGGDEVAQEGSGNHLPGLRMQFDISKLRCPVDGDEQVKFAFGRLNLSNINVEVAERAGLTFSS